MRFQNHFQNITGILEPPVIQQQFISHILPPLLWRMAYRYVQKQLEQSFARHRSQTCCCALAVPVLISWNTHIPWLLLPDTFGVFFFFSVIQVIREKTCLSREFTAARWCGHKAEDTQEARTLSANRQSSASGNCLAISTSQSGPFYNT